MYMCRLVDFTWEIF